MAIWDIFKREKRSVSGTGYTGMLIGARQDYLAGTTGIAELTGTVQSCVTLWANVLSLADVNGTSILDRHTMAMIGRALALRGEAVFYIGDTGSLVAVSDWDLSTRNGRPYAYRLSISEANGNKSITALAAEVLHFRIGSDATSPWQGSAPLHRARLSAGLLHSVETALSEIYEEAPLGSQIVPFPESPDVDMEALGRGFRGRRGRVLLRESTSVAAAGGVAPQQDWRGNDVTPDIRGALPTETLDAARASVLSAFGVLPALVGTSAQGNLVREAQRHLCTYMLQPIAAVMAEEASNKLGGGVTIDTLRPVQAFDTGGRARALATIIQALGQAKELGVDPEQALKLVHWEDSV